MDVQTKNRPSSWDEAAGWYARLHGPDCTGRDRADFEAWLRADSSHWHAYAEAERVTRALDQLIEADSSLRVMADAGLNDAAAPRRSRGIPAALAASVVAALLAFQAFESFDTSPANVETYANTTDRQRLITLADRSTVHLDVNSEVAVQMEGAQRRITLIRGRALFDVEKDASRPFVVAAGATRTTALGTVFQVEREAERVVVVLTEGSVAVTPADERRHWREQLEPGEQLSMRDSSSVPVKHTVDGAAETSWSRGRLVFRGTPLGDALDDVNRYSTRKVRLADPTLAELKVGGTFIAGDSELIVSAFAAVLPIRTVDSGGGEILLFRRYETDSP